jgi:DNA-binding beta-propeller fold protein YncE
MRITRSPFASLLLAAASCGAIGLSAIHVHAQSIQLKVENLDASGGNLSVWIDEASETGFTELTADEFEGYLQGSPIFPGYALHYRCDQQLLTCDPARTCYLYLFLMKSGGPVDNRIWGWYEKHRVRVVGDFTDQRIRLPVQVAVDNQKGTSLLPLAVHQAIPLNALLPEPRKLDIPTGIPSTHELRFANQTECNIQILSDDRLALKPTDDSLWMTTTASTVSSGNITTDRTMRYQPGVVLTFRPNGLKAFWKSLLPYSEANPHASLSLRVPYKVEGGYGAEISENITVEFRPSLVWVVLSVVVGALLSATISHLAAPADAANARSQGTAPKEVSPASAAAGTPAPAADATLPNAPKARPTGRVRRLVRDVALRVVVAVVVFFAYLFLKGSTEVVLFDFPFDPTQLIPAAIIGLLVGMRPVFLINKLMGAVGLPNGIGVFVLATFIGLFVLVGTGEANGLRTFQPVSLSYDAATNSLYCVSSSTNAVYSMRLSGSQQAFGRVATLPAGAVMVDACVVGQAQSLWMAMVGQIGKKGSSAKFGTLQLITLAGKPPLSSSAQSGLGPWRGVAYDPDRQCLYTIESGGGAIHVVPLSARGIESKGYSLPLRNLSSPSRILVAGGDIYVVDSSLRSVIRISSEGQELRRYGGGLEDIAGVAVSATRQFLFVADAGRCQVPVFSLSTGAQMGSIKYVGFREPRAMAISGDNRLWVADPAASALFSFTLDGYFLARYVPAGL